ncbi:uncharacterized protein [Aegilops tauschii subsp. strangulata]|uniref:uncharacterized protein isoform X2 n=1 Tax=Aegilops tauschii subsp. strangulata TaxID=200361 RepID=UPI001ABCAF0F|nr:uncharacterized protein LOC109775420 isoform X2 [Aegilops tauschii subsp. strangulata]
MRGGLGEGGSERTGQGRRPASACAGEVAHPAAKGTAGTGRGGPRQTSGRQQGAPHGEERTRSTPSFPTRYEKEEIGPRKLVVHIFMCHAEKNPNGELGIPSNVAFVLSPALWSSSIALLARHLLGWRNYFIVGSFHLHICMNTPISAMKGKGQAPVTKYLANHRALGTLVTSSSLRLPKPSGVYQ